MIKFKCNECGAAMETPDSLAGQPEKCPNCGLLNRVPAARPATQPRPDALANSSGLRLPSDTEGQLAQETGSISSPQDKACPYCGEMIKAAAILCRFCGMNLQTGRPVHSETQPQQQRAVPQRVTYYPQHDAFQGTLPLMVRLAVKAVHDVGFKLENASDSAGVVTFRTGVTWGSWSGVSGSIAIEDAGADWFRVTGAGKQNVQGGQVLAINLFGEANSKVNRVIAQMKVLAR